MQDKIQKAISDGVIDPEHHVRLLRDIDKVSRVAGIPVSFILTSAVDICTAEELVWVKALKSHEHANLAFVNSSKPSTPSETRMMALTGLFIRNFINAQYMSVTKVLKSDPQELLEPTVLLIPNFFLSRANGGGIATWHVSDLYGLLLHRTGLNKSTIIHIDNFSVLTKEYGQGLSDHIKTYFKIMR